MSNDNIETWHLNRSVSITHILATASMLATVVAMWADLDKNQQINAMRIEQLEQNQMTIKQLDTRVAVIESVMSQYRTTQIEMREDLKTIKRSVRGTD